MLHEPITERSQFLGGKLFDFALKGFNFRHVIQKFTIAAADCPPPAANDGPRGVSSCLRSIPVQIRGCRATPERWNGGRTPRLSALTQRPRVSRTIWVLASRQIHHANPKRFTQLYLRGIVHGNESGAGSLWPSKNGRRRRSASRLPNGLEVNPRGRGPRAEAVAARRMPAFEARGADGVTPSKYR